MNVWNHATYFRNVHKQSQTNQKPPDLSHTIQHYTQQLVKDTNGYIKDLSTVPVAPAHSEQRQRKIQRERLQDEFASALNMFQAAQKSAAQKVKEQMNRAREKAFGEPFLGSYKKDQQLIELQDNSAARQQQQMQEEVDLRALEEQEQNIRQLEVGG